MSSRAVWVSSLLLLMLCPQLCHVISSPSLVAQKAAFLKRLGLDKEPVIEVRPPVPAFVKGLYQAYDHLAQDNPDLGGQDIQVKPAVIVPVSSREFLHLRVNFPIIVDNVAQIALVAQIQPHAYGGTNMPTESLICERTMDVCELVSAQRHKDMSASEQWDLFDLSYLLRTWRAFGLESVQSLDLNVTFQQLASDPFHIYHLNGTDRPQLVSWRYPEPPEVLQHIGTPERRRRDVDSGSEEEGPDYCSVRRWYVDFAEFGWTTWVLNPRGFIANYCGGECIEPLNNPLVSTTNNAYIRSVARANLGHRYLSETKCSSLHLDHLPITYIDDNGTVRMKTLHEMITVRCGCL